MEIAALIGKTMTETLSSQRRPSRTTRENPSYKLSQEWRDRVLKMDPTVHPKMPSAMENLERWAKAAIRNERRDTRSIVLTGPTGTGKTTMAKRVMRYLSETAMDAYCRGWWNRSGVPSGVRIFWPDASDTSPQQWGELRSECARAHWLFLDDIGAETDEFKGKRNVGRLLSILEERTNMWNIITTNIPSAQWSEMWDERIDSRLSQFARISLAGFPDYRRKE